MIEGIKQLLNTDTDMKHEQWTKIIIVWDMERETLKP